MNITSSAGASTTSASFTVSPVRTSGSAKSGASVPSGSICDSTLIPPRVNAAARYAALVPETHSEDAIIPVHERWNHGSGGASASGPDPGGPGGASPHDPVGD